MNLLSFTISKKLFFIFLINSIITVTISGMVMISFLGLSGQFNYNSELSTYKTILDSIRIEQSKLKGHAQSFYLNVTEDTVKEGLSNFGDSIKFFTILELKSIRFGFFKICNPAAEDPKVPVTHKRSPGSNLFL